MAEQIKSCSVVDCSKSASHKDGGALGYCRAHYKRFRATGYATGSLRKDSACLSWLKKTANCCADECISWPFATNKAGYGIMHNNGKTRLAHRVMMEIKSGEIRADLDVAHSCGNGARGCVNPNHLRWDTRAGNFSDKVLHGTHNRGEKSPAAKLSNEQVSEIRSLQSIESQKAIAKRYSVDPSNISKIIRGRSRKFG